MLNNPGGSGSSGDTTNQENAAIATGTLNDTAATSSSTSGSMVSWLRGIFNGIGSLVAGIKQAFVTPDNKSVMMVTNQKTLFTDDFGGTTLNTTNWTVLQGGYTGIGTGTYSGMSYSVGSSNLTVNMGTVANSEVWFMSNTVLTGSQDITFSMMKNNNNSNNSIFVGLVQVDTNGNPIVNPNLAGYTNNYGGVELGIDATYQGVRMEACADGSNVLSSSYLINYTGQTYNNLTEFLLECHAEDFICSVGAPDGTGGRLFGARESTQVPNDGMLYKLVLRFKNGSTAPSATTVNFGRVLVVDNQEARVEVASARGDTIGQKGLAVNLATSGLGSSGGNPLYVQTGISGGSGVRSELFTTTGTNITQIRSDNRYIIQLHAWNSDTVPYWLKLFASNPTLGTTSPFFNQMIAAGGRLDYMVATFLSNSSPIYAAVTLGASPLDNTPLTTAGKCGIDFETV